MKIDDFEIGMPALKLRETFGDRLKPSDSSGADKTSLQVDKVRSWDWVVFYLKEGRVSKVFAGREKLDDAQVEASKAELTKGNGAANDKYQLPQLKLSMLLWGDGKIAEGPVMPVVKAKGEYLHAWYMPCEKGGMQLWLTLATGTE